MTLDYFFSNILLLMLIVGIAVGSTVRSLQDSWIPVLLINIVIILVYCTYTIFKFGLIRRAASFPIYWLFFWLLLLIYSLLISTLNGFGAKDGMALYLRLTPLILIPIYAYFIRRQWQWNLIALSIVVSGIIGAYIDIRHVNILNGIPRLMSEEYSSVDYFYSLIICVYIALFSRQKHTLKLLFILPTFILIPRMVMAVSRGEIALFIFFILLCFSINIFNYFKITKIIYFSVIFTVTIFGYLYLNSSTELSLYFNILNKRSQYTEMSANYRVSEFTSALKYASIFGDGISSKRDFSSALKYTTSSKAVGRKTYTHEFISFLLWKFGFIVGGLIITMLCVWMFGIFRRINEKKDDDLYILSALIVLLFLGHSMINMYFLRIEAYMLIIPFAAYLFQKTHVDKFPSKSRRPIRLAGLSRLSV